MKSTNMHTSPTKTGEVRVDQYWLLKSKPQWAYLDETEGCPIEPVIAEKCDRDGYLHAPQAKRFIAIWGQKIHGRRINDEVELFEDGEGKETRGLRVSLERKGLTVRSYAPEDSSKKDKFPKPSKKAILGKDGDTSLTELEKCVLAAKRGIDELEDDEDTTIDYAYLIDGHSSKKGFIVCGVRAAEFYEMALTATDTLSCRGVRYPVLAIVECGELRVSCEEKTFMSYFTLKSHGGYHVNLAHHDFLADFQREQKELAKAEKKRAKKHRRQMTRSTVTSPSVDSFVSASQSVEDDEAEAIKERQRDKNRMKKKAQKERRRAKQGDGAAPQNVFVGDAEKKSNGDNTNKPTVYGFVNRQLIVGTSDTEDLQLAPPRRQIQPTDLASGNDDNRYESKDTKKRKTVARSISSDGESDGTDSKEEANGLDVIWAGTQEGYDRALQACRKRPGSILVAHLEESDQEVAEIKKDMKYLGRGL